MWLTWGSTSSMCELAIRKVIIHKAHEDFLISIDRLVVVPVVVLHGIAVRQLCSFSREICVPLVARAPNESMNMKQSSVAYPCRYWKHDVQTALKSDQWEFSFRHRIYATMPVPVCSLFEPTPGMDLLAYTS